MVLALHLPESLYRLSDDVLISYNAPPLMRGKSAHYMYEDPGSSMCVSLRMSLI